MKTVEELVRLGRFVDTGDCGICEITGCLDWATHYVKIVRVTRVRDTWRLCKLHRDEYFAADKQQRGEGEMV